VGSRGDAKNVPRRSTADARRSVRRRPSERVPTLSLLRQVPANRQRPDARARAQTSKDAPKSQAWPLLRPPGMHELTESLLRHGGTLAFGEALVQQLGVPIPVEGMLVLAGSLAAKGLLSPLRMVAATAAGTVLADAVWYVVGRRYGDALLRLVRRLWPSQATAAEGGSWFSRWGLRALLVVRILPGAAQLIVSMAGARRIKLRAFAFYDLAGILLWASSFFIGGMILHRQAEMALQALSSSTAWLVIAGLLAVVLLYRWSRRARGRSDRASGSLGPAGGQPELQPGVE
jgi:membrane protein DedA with SNARE-associated domain